jgi:hypothetical protein
MALIGLTDEDMGRTQLTEGNDDDTEFDDNDVNEAYGEEQSDDGREILLRVKDTLGTLIESIEQEDLEEAAKSYGLVSEIAVSLAEAFAEMNDDGVLSEDTDDGEEIVEHLTDLARACLEMNESLEDGASADADVYEQLAENIEAVLGGIELYEGLLAEMSNAPFDEENDGDDDDDE